VRSARASTPREICRIRPQTCTVADGFTALRA
jgi:hypothetical protein